MLNMRLFMYIQIKGCRSFRSAYNPVNTVVAKSVLNLLFFII